MSSVYEPISSKIDLQPSLALVPIVASVALGTSFTDILCRNIS